MTHFLKHFALAATLCALSLPAWAQAPAAGVVRNELQKFAIPPGVDEILQTRNEIPANFHLATHTHPGIELSYVLKGSADVYVEGKLFKHVKAGDSFMIPAGNPHSAIFGPEPSELVAVYIIDKSKPLTTNLPDK